MSLFERIRADALAARVARSPDTGVLVTLIGEIETKTKTFSPERPMTDEEVLAVVRKFLKNMNETLRLLVPGKADAAIARARTEKTALEVYQPVQLSAREIEEFATQSLAAGANLGAVMAALKAQHAGKYDGKLASEIVRRVVASA